MGDVTPDQSITIDGIRRPVRQHIIDYRMAGGFVSTGSDRLARSGVSLEELKGDGEGTSYLNVQGVTIEIPTAKLHPSHFPFFNSYEALDKASDESIEKIFSALSDEVKGDLQSVAEERGGTPQEWFINTQAGLLTRLYMRSLEPKVINEGN